MKTTILALVLAFALVSCEKEPMQQTVKAEVINVTETSVTVRAQVLNFESFREAGIEVHSDSFVIPKEVCPKTEFITMVEGLESGRKYTVKAYVIVTGWDRIYSDEVEFITLGR